VLVLLWWLIPIGAVALATWWVYAVAPTDSPHPDRPKTRRQLDRMGAALAKPVAVRRSCSAGSPRDAVIDVTDRSEADSRYGDK
jgi:hypothetical protein